MSYPEVKFATGPKMLVVSMPHRGAYSQIGETMRRLKEWLDSKGGEQSGHPFCLYFDNPGETPEADLRSEACIPVQKPVPADGEVQVKELEEAQVAETRHPGPPEEFGKTYGPFLEGLLNSGYRLVGPAREYYMTVLDVKGPGSGFVIQQPIEKR